MTMFRSSLRHAFAVAVLAATPSVASACEPEFVQSAQTISLPASDAGDNLRVETNEQLRIRNTANGQCSAFLRFARLSTSNPNPARTFTITSGGQVLDILPSETSAASSSSDLFVPGIPGGSANGSVVPIRLSFPTPWGVASGTSSETLLVQLIDETGRVFDDLILTVNLTVLPTVELKLYGATGNNRIARVDLGTLDPRTINRSDPFGVRVWSTSPYSVTFASSNTGDLAHSVASDRIRYNLRAEGRTVDLTGAAPGAFGRQTDGLGYFHPLEITVPPFTAQAGEYSDRIMVTVTAG